MLGRVTQDRLLLPEVQGTSRKLSVLQLEARFQTEPSAPGTQLQGQQQGHGRQEGWQNLGGRRCPPCPAREQDRAGPHSVQASPKAFTFCPSEGNPVLENKQASKSCPRILSFQIHISHPFPSSVQIKSPAPFASSSNWGWGVGVGGDGNREGECASSLETCDQNSRQLLTTLLFIENECLPGWLLVQERGQSLSARFTQILDFFFPLS